MGENSYGVQMTKCSLCSSVQLDRIINSYFFPTAQLSQFNIMPLVSQSIATLEGFVFRGHFVLFYLFCSIHRDPCLWWYNHFVSLALWESTSICNQASTRFQVEISVNSSSQRKNWKWSASLLIYIPSFWNTLFSWGTSKKKSACFSFKFQPFAGVVEYKEHRNLNHYRKSEAHSFTKDSSWGKLKLKLPSPVCWGLGDPLMSVLEVGSIVGICRALRRNWRIKPSEK